MLENPAGILAHIHRLEGLRGRKNRVMLNLFQHLVVAGTPQLKELRHAVPPTAGSASTSLQ